METRTLQETADFFQVAIGIDRDGAVNIFGGIPTLNPATHRWEGIKLIQGKDAEAFLCALTDIDNHRSREQLFRPVKDARGRTIKVLEPIPEHVRSGWYAYLNSGENVLVETILTEGDGTRRVRIVRDGKRELVPLSAFSTKPCPFPDWLKKGAKVRISTGTIGILTALRQVQFSWKAVVKFQDGKVIWYEPCEVQPADEG